MCRGLYYAFSKVLNNPTVLFRRKLAVVKAYLLTGGTYHCGRWSEPNKTIFSKLNHAVLKIYRSAVGNAFFKKDISELLCDKDVVYEYNLIAPVTLIRSSRLQLFSRMVGKNVHLLLDTLFHCSNVSGGWVSALKKDFQWLSMSGKIIVPTYEVDQLVQCVATNPRALSNQVRRFSLSPFANLDLLRNAPSLSPNSNVSLCCNVCGSVQPSLQQLRLHMLKKAW